MMWFLVGESDADDHGVVRDDALAQAQWNNLNPVHMQPYIVFIWF